MPEDRLKKIARGKFVKTVKAVDTAIDIIRNEIIANGYYPHGRLSKSEVCRRAGTSLNTIKNKWHADTASRIDAFVVEMKAKLGTQKSAGESVKLDEIGSLRNALSKLATELHICELDKIDLENKVRSSETEIGRLRKQLKVGSSDTNVTLLPNKK